MIGRNKKSGTGTRSTPSAEIRLKARAVSRGIAIGRVVWLHGTNRQFYRVSLAESEIDREIKRFQKALTLAQRQLSKIAGSRSGNLPASGPAILESHRQMIEDAALRSKIESVILDQKVNAEWAIKHVTEIYVAQYKAIKDENLRDRYIDVEDIGERLISALGGTTTAELPFSDDSIIAAGELKPSTLVELAGTPPRAIITENGGWTSHTFILAREMRLPAVTGLKKIDRRIKTGDAVIVDGYNGHVILNPTRETLTQYSPVDALRDTASVKGDNLRTRTLDRREVRIYVNAESPAVYQKAKAGGAGGIGLYRSEFLLDQTRGLPSEAKQLAAYREIADAAEGETVRIRTFDLGTDRLVDLQGIKEKNPALGLRAIRLGLTFEKLLRAQLRALLRASFDRNVHIVVPMVSGVSEMRAVKQRLQTESDLLKAKGQSVGNPKVGAMIEVPSAVLMIRELIDESDFVCLGTNDLIQYLLAADRDNEAVAGWYRTLHPAVLRAVRRVLEAAGEAQKPAIVCGEMAGSPYYVPVLVGLGASELSINVNSIARVRTVISGIAADEARKLVLDLETARTVEDVESAVDKAIRKNWLHLFPEDFSFSR